MRTMQGRMVGGSNSLRTARKTSGRLCFMGNFSAKNAYQTIGLGVVIPFGDGILLVVSLVSI